MTAMTVKGQTFYRHFFGFYGEFAGSLKVSLRLLWNGL